MGNTSIGSFSVPIGPGAFCLNCHFHGGALSVSPFRTLTGAYQSSLVAFATGGIYGIWTHNLLNAIESLYPIGAKTPFSIYKTYADLRRTNCLIFVYIQPVGRQVWAIRSDPKLLAPVVPSAALGWCFFLPYPTQEWLPATFTRHSEIIFKQ